MIVLEITIVLGFLSLIVTSLVLSYKQRTLFLPILVPVMFVLFFAYSTIIPNYIGYAVDFQYVTTMEQAIVLAVQEENSGIYLFVQFPNEKEPRIVRIENTEANRQTAESLAQSAKKGLTTARFGVKKGKDKNGEQQQTDVEGQSFQTTEVLSKP